MYCQDLTGMVVSYNPNNVSRWSPSRPVFMLEFYQLPYPEAMPLTNRPVFQHSSSANMNLMTTGMQRAML